MQHRWELDELKELKSLQARSWHLHFLFSRGCTRLNDSSSLQKCLGGGSYQELLRLGKEAGTLPPCQVMHLSMNDALPSHHAEASIYPGLPVRGPSGLDDVLPHALQQWSWGDSVCACQPSAALTCLSHGRLAPLASLLSSLLHVHSGLGSM